MKSSNPKDQVGVTKLPLHLWPVSATALGSLALLDGKCKYGRANWREHGVLATVYVDAMMRHAYRWLEGLDDDPDSGLPQFAHILACPAIIVDAMATGKLIDDRQYNGAGVLAFLDAISPNVARIHGKYRDLSPKHYTIKDNA